MNKDNLYVISFDREYSENCVCPMVALFNVNTISEKEARKVIKQGSFIYDRDPRLVVMTMEQYTNLCK